MLRFRPPKPDNRRVDQAVERWLDANPQRRVPHDAWASLYDAPLSLTDQQLAARVHELGEGAHRQAKPSANKALDKLNKNPSLAATIYDFEHPESGLGARTMGVQWNHGKGGRITGVFTKNGEELPEGQWERDLHFDPADGEGRAYHSLMELPSSAQDNGFSAAWLNHLIQQYGKHGVKQIDLHANIDVGAYAWAKHGFTPHPNEHQHILDSFKKYANDQWGAGKLSDADLDKANAVKHIKDVADFDTGELQPVWTNEAKLRGTPRQGHMGKAFLINTYGSGHPDFASYNGGVQGGGWHGALRLDKADPDFSRGMKYRAAKLAKLKPLPDAATGPESLATAPPPTQSIQKALGAQIAVCAVCKRQHKGEGWHAHTGSDHLIHHECLRDDGPLAPFRQLARTLRKELRS